MDEPSTQEKHETILGSCPVCAGTIPTDGLLIRYEQRDGWLKLLAECPRCAAVVCPT